MVWFLEGTYYSKYLILKTSQRRIIMSDWDVKQDRRALAGGTRPSLADMIGYPRRDIDGWPALLGRFGLARRSPSGGGGMALTQRHLLERGNQATIWHRHPPGILPPLSMSSGFEWVLLPRHTTQEKFAFCLPWLPGIQWKIWNIGYAILQEHARSNI